MTTLVVGTSGATGKKLVAKDVKTIHMTTANKISRIVAWTFKT